MRPEGKKKKLRKRRKMKPLQSRTARGGPSDLHIVYNSLDSFSRHSFDF